MKTLLLTALMGTSVLSAIAQERQFDRLHTIDYLVVYDQSNPEFIAAKGGREAYAQEVVDSINVVLKNSQLDYRFRLAGVHYWHDYKAPNIEQGHDALANSAEIQAIRRKTKADLVVLLTESFGDTNSGLADHNDNAIHTDAYSCVNLSMAASAYTAAHEAGHILGGYHSRSEYEQAPSDHPWAAAYVSPKGYKTVLCGMAPGTTVPIFSGPSSVWKGEVMGDDRNDNVRILRHNLPRAAQFGDHLDLDQYYSSRDVLVFDKNPQEGQVTVYGNQFMLIHSADPWITQVAPTWGNVEAEVKFRLAPNTTGKSRTGTITVSGDANTTKEISIVQTAADFNIDGNQGSYQGSQEQVADQLNFLRDFKDTEWQSLCLPFVWQYEDWQKDFEIARIESVRQTEQGGVALNIRPLTDGALQPHTPYLIRAKKPEAYEVALHHVPLFPATASAVHLATAAYRLTVKGTYQPVAGQVMYNQGAYTLKGGRLAQTDEVDARLNAFQWYAEVTDSQGNALPAPQQIQIVNLDAPTGIQQVQTSPDAGNLYDLNGRRITDPGKNSQGLPKGVYIINGKKVML